MAWTLRYNLLDQIAIAVAGERIKGMLLATWNVNSIKVRLPQLLKWLESTKPDVVCLQETKITDDKFPKKELEAAGFNLAFHGERTYNGVAILSRSLMTSVHLGLPESPLPVQPRLIKAEIDNVVVVNVYIPNGSSVGSDKFIYKMRWLEALRNFLVTVHQPTERLVICGDFNVAPTDEDVFNADLADGQVMFTDQEKDALRAIKDWGFTDTFRMHVPGGGHYSWWDYRQGAFRRNMGWRIDHIWATEPLAKTCKTAWIDKEPRKLEQPSDHTPVLAEFVL